MNETRRAVRDGVLQIAAARQTVTYGEVAGWIGWSTRNSHHRRLLGELLGQINRHEDAAGRPMLSAVVVCTDIGRPGSGFYEEARRLGRLTGSEDGFHEQELAAVWGEWEREARER